MSQFRCDYNFHFLFFFSLLSLSLSCLDHVPLPAAFLPPEALYQLVLAAGITQGLAHGILDVEGAVGDVTV